MPAQLTHPSSPEQHEEDEELDEDSYYIYESADHRKHRLEAEDRERYWRNPNNGWDRSSSVESVIRSPLPTFTSPSKSQESPQAIEQTTSSASASEHEPSSRSPFLALLTPGIEVASSTDRPSISSAGTLQAEDSTAPVSSTDLGQVQSLRSPTERRLHTPTRSSRPPLPTTTESPLVQTSQATRLQLYALPHRNRDSTSQFPVYTDPVAIAPFTPSPSSDSTFPTLSRAPLGSVDINASPQASSSRNQIASATDPQPPRRRARSHTVHEGDNPIVTPLVDADFRLARIANRLREEGLNTDLAARQHVEEERRRLTEETDLYFTNPRIPEQTGPSFAPQSNLGFLRHQERQSTEPHFTTLQEHHTRREGQVAQQEDLHVPRFQEDHPRREDQRPQATEQLIPAFLRGENNRDGWRGEHSERTEAEIQQNRRLAAGQERRQARAALTQSGGYRGTSTRLQRPRTFDRDDRDRTPRPHDRRSLSDIWTAASGGEIVTDTQPEPPSPDQDTTQFTRAPRSSSNRNNFDQHNPDRRVLAIFALPEPPTAVFEQLYSQNLTDTNLSWDLFDNPNPTIVTVPTSAESPLKKSRTRSSHKRSRSVTDFSSFDETEEQHSLPDLFKNLNLGIGSPDMNYSQYSDASQGGPNPRQAPPSPSQGLPHSNGMNNGMAAGTGLVGFPTPAGHQSDLNYVMSMVEELSGILRVNQQLTANVVDKMGKVREKAKHLNLTNDEMIATVAQQINEESENLERENSELRKALDRSEHSRTENFKLAVHGAEIIGDIAEKLHHFKEQQEVDTLAWHKNYRKQLAEEREENLNLRNQINDMKAAACRASENLRQMRRFVTDNDKWTELEIENHRLRAEKRLWKRCALPLIPDDDSEWSDDDDMIDPEEKKREAAKKEKERQNKEDGDDQLS